MCRRSLAEILAELRSHLTAAEISSIVARAEPYAVTGRVTSDGMMIAIGECCDTWPESILPDVCDTAQIIPFFARRSSRSDCHGQ